MADPRLTEPAGLAAAICAGDRRALARAITLVESSRPDHRRVAEAVLEAALLAPAHGASSIRVGISGVPGVGKSTFIEALGNHIVAAGHRLAVLAIDPSSQRSGGSILGDKTRMEKLARSEAAFIRPSPTGGTLGGVTRRTRETMLLCEAAGFDVVIVETVGIGQSETAVADLVDMFVLLMLPGGGDELQGIKKGVVELADLILVNKADGEFGAAAQRAVADYRSALRLLRPAASHWRPEVLAVSALTGTNINQMWHIVGRFRRTVEATGALAARRAEQARAALWAEISAGLLEQLRLSPVLRDRLPEIEDEVMAGRAAPAVAARRLLEAFLAGTLGPPAGDTEGGRGIG
ncbi:MAG TPA: methylmalonyl Co-A mutase-associated GTPase MeaB [Stellaceae bacterium]|nr:methylmalonyl Co-A mutase-associated GTPase MeaB [Stellaceae bacterium]